MSAALVLTMRQRVARYLHHRRQFGYKLESTGLLLKNFARFADRTAPRQALTIELAQQWALSPKRLSPIYRSARLNALRGFGRYCALFDAETQVLPKAQYNPGRKRSAPHIYTSAQVRSLMRDTSLLKPSWSPLRAQTMQTVIGLLWCTGIRIGEAVCLRDSDFDPRAATLCIAPKKFSPQRIIPIHPSVVQALERYQRKRQRRYPRSDYLFVSHSGKGGMTLRATIEFYFKWLASPLTPNGDLEAVRLHDFRHTFASNWVAKWSRQAAPLPHHLVLLARYLGHNKFSDTYWYVQPNRSALQHAAIIFQNYRQCRDQA